jgi:predicted transcriptional regulator
MSDKPKTKLLIELAPEEKQALKKIAKNESRSMSGVIRNFIKQEEKRTKERQ